MEDWKKLEFEYAKRLRESNTLERRMLYAEAYTKVSELSVQRFRSDTPEDRTAGTSKRLVSCLSRIFCPTDTVLEIGCGRGFTCLMLAPHVESIVGTDFSESSLSESKEVLSKRGVTNVEIRHVSAYALAEDFDRESFSAALSIEVVEHLHSEDAEEHLRQVFDILKPGGKYVIVMPNRLTGPHDVTREEFPEARHPLGFHLNESTHEEMIEMMRGMGYNRFRSFVHVNKPTKVDSWPIYMPCQLSVFCERLYRVLPGFLRLRTLQRLMSIRLIAHKP